MKKSKFDLRRSLSAIAQSWPRPQGELVFFIEEDHLWLHKIRLPSHARGTGTEKMAEILSLTDRAGLLVCLTADPLDEDDIGEGQRPNPTTFDLVKWYCRFDFAPLGHSEDGFLMERKASGLTKQEILFQYNLNKKNDLSLQEFEQKWPKEQPRSLGPSF